MWKERLVALEEKTRWKGSEAVLDPRPGGVHRVGGIAGVVTWAEFRDPAGNVVGISFAES